MKRKYFFPSKKNFFNVQNIKLLEFFFKFESFLKRFYILKQALQKVFFKKFNFFLPLFFFALLLFIIFCFAKNEEEKKHKSEKEKGKRRKKLLKKYFFYFLFEFLCQCVHLKN